jgi:hypothetical protein
MKKHAAPIVDMKIISIRAEGTLTFAIVPIVERFLMPDDTEFLNLLQRLKRPAPVDRCDTDEYPGCGGPLYRWTLHTTLDYWPVIRCENHIKLQHLWQDYQRDVWDKIGNDPAYDENLRPLGFWDWLNEHADVDTSQVDRDFKYWEPVGNMAENGH